ncbi:MULTISPECIES: hypothetical protein [Bacillus]|uniref:hypothetical protein n=1 Tax=Bacillus TaxID=1386 RepID=UPI0015E081B5|nr:MULTISPECIES: hypothetical protein [Bacillus]
MDISEKLTQKSLQEILIKIYMKGQESDKIEVKELIEEIKQQVISAVNTAK